jgi:pimeloyl-ACP methyl ester carboxylesterase
MQGIKILFNWLLVLATEGLYAQQPHIYLLSGIGSDERIFSYITCPEGYTCSYIQYTIPDKGATMEEYARQLADQIDTREPFSLIGVSLGGMLAVEMSHFLQPEQTIILSSACTALELPIRYRIQKSFPVYRLFSGNMLKQSSFAAQSVAEPDRRQEAAVCNAMLHDKDPIFLERSLAMTIQWEREQCEADVVHIHGSKDHTIPLRHTDADIIVVGGSHMMTLTSGKILNNLLQSVITL